MSLHFKGQMEISVKPENKRIISNYWQPYLSVKIPIFPLLGKQNMVNVLYRKGWEEEKRCSDAIPKHKHVLVNQKHFPDLV